ncbi:hypothetical protein CK203_006401 [Vitis vinifera]|uniref:Uncharacterized protein n=1 Tax=Vitis vinifera TaxID=29760 RepID=A0A438KBI4_VITVI|nr:hypothetical protein CK203_006401 [Vitis vinifera]
MQRGFLCGVSPLWHPNGGNGGRKPGLPSCEPSPLALVPVKGPASRRSSSARNLKSGLIGRLQDRFQETIEVSCSSVQDDHPEGSETEMATETPAVPVVVPDEGTPGETHPAEMRGPGSGGGLCGVGREAETDSTRLDHCHAFSKDVRSGGNAGERSSRHGQQHDLFTDLLRTADYMKASPLSAKIVKISCA